MTRHDTDQNNETIQPKNVTNTGLMCTGGTQVVTNSAIGDGARIVIPPTSSPETPK